MAAWSRNMFSCDHKIQDLLRFCLGRNIRMTESNITLVVSILTWPITVTVILPSRTCVCTTIMKMTLKWWNPGMPSAEKGSFGQIHSGRSCHHVCVHSLHTSRSLFHGRTWSRTFCLKIFWIIMMMEHCVAHRCSSIVVLSVHVCCKTCIMLRLPFQSHWSIFHKSLPLSYLSRHWGRLISCQGVQRLVTENQLITVSLNWFLDIKISGRRRCVKCTLKIAVCSEELMDVSIPCSNILRMLSYSFGNLVTMFMSTPCLCHSCIHIMNNSIFMIGVRSPFHVRWLVL